MSRNTELGYPDALYCFHCMKAKETFIKVNDKLVCVNCRYNEIGKEAFKEKLYNGKMLSL
jgi:hypothetical protein